jgi:hypothetical protein
MVGEAAEHLDEVVACVERVERERLVFRPTESILDWCNRSTKFGTSASRGTHVPT